MKESTKAVSLVLIITLIIASVFLGINSSASTAAPVQQAAPIVKCDLQVGQQTRVVCTAAGVVVLNTAINVPTVTLPPITVEVPLPGTTETVTIPPRPNETVTVPGPTSTVEAPTQTETVTASPTIGPRPTVTVTEEVTRQAPTESVTISPDTEPTAPVDEEDDLFFDFSVRDTVIGLSSILALVAIVLLAMYMGYAIGYKDSDKENVRFLRALRDNIVSRK